MQNQLSPIGLGFIPALVSIGSAIIGAVGSKKKEKKAIKQAGYQASMEAIQAGAAIAAPQAMTETDIATLRSIWPQIRQVQHFALINWAKVGKDISAPAKAALSVIWPEVREAAQFGAVNWPYHAVPIEAVAPLLPLPELGYQTPTYSEPGQTSRYQSASLFGGQETPYLIAGSVGIALLLLLSSRR